MAWASSPTAVSRAPAVVAPSQRSACRVLVSWYLSTRTDRSGRACARHVGEPEERPPSTGAGRRSRAPGRPASGRCRPRRWRGGRRAPRHPGVCQSSYRVSGVAVLTQRLRIDAMVSLRAARGGGGGRQGDRGRRARAWQRARRSAASASDEDGEGRVEAQRPPVEAEEPVGDGVEGAAPGLPGDAGAAELAGPAEQLGRRPPAEGEEQHAPAVPWATRRATRPRAVVFPVPGAGHHQEVATVVGHGCSSASVRDPVSVANIRDRSTEGRTFPEASSGDA